MGQQIIKQPNGLYCIFNSVCDGVTYFDLTQEEILEVWVQEYRERTAFDLLKTLGLIDAGKPAYYQFTRSFEEALDTTEETFGAKEREVLLADMMSPEAAAKKLAEAKPVELPDDYKEMLEKHLKELLE
jgi:hypothetical protein